jgi:murein DD-endopeptidase MepM/ murein hydrolase activator NlpD
MLIMRLFNKKYLILFLFLPLPVFGLSLNLRYPIIGNSFEYIENMGFSGLITWFYYLIIGLSSAFALGAIVWGGMEYLTSAGNQARLRSAIDRIQNAIIGLLLVLISGLVVNTISPGLLNIDDSDLPYGEQQGIIGFPEWPENPFPDDVFNVDPSFPTDPGGPINPPPPGVGCENVDPGQTIPYGDPVQGGGKLTGGPNSFYGCRPFASIYSDYCYYTPQKKGGSFHRGVDMLSVAGGSHNSFNKPICTRAVGYVSSVNMSTGCVYIKHPASGYETYYTHLNTINVSKGQEVVAGQQIGTMGWRGYVFPQDIGGTHLHYEIRHPYGKNNHKNPCHYMDVEHCRSWHY